MPVTSCSNDSPQSFELFKEWLSNCCENHSECQKLEAGLGYSPSLLKNPHFLPTRLVDLGREKLLHPKLCNKEELLESPRYMTLSHCWGKTDMYCLKTDTLDTFRVGIPIQRLSKTFKDAMITARRLGSRYIWIDSLCIIQDNAEDWRNESSQMGAVFRHSWCTIAAAAAPDGRHGCFSQSGRDKMGLALPIYRCIGTVTNKEHSIDQDKLYSICDENLWECEVSKSTLSNRAWAFQERLCSPRTLHFGRHQAFWECSVLQACEMFPRGNVPPKGGLIRDTVQYFRLESPVPMQDVNEDTITWLTRWRELVADYSARSLTYPEKDKLVAFSGLAQSFGRDIYLAGL